MKLNTILYSSNTPLPNIACCDHYAGNEKFIRKAFALQKNLGPIFDITCDLEDGAVVGKEAEHAELVAGLICSDDNVHNATGFRIHDFQHPHWKNDLEIVLAQARDCVSHITIPKTESYQELCQVIDVINSLSKKLDIPLIRRLHVLIETHTAIEEVFLIAAHPQICSLEFGLMDFVSAHSGAIPAACMESPGQFDHPLIIRAKTRIAAAAAAHSKIASHNVTTAFSDRDVTLQDATKARSEFGYLRMWSIHPTQIEPIVEAMRPSSAEIGFACDLLLTAQKAEWGPIRFQDRLHDRASFRYYWELLKRAARTGAELPDHVQDWI